MHKVWSWLDRHSWSLPPALAAGCAIDFFALRLLLPLDGAGEFLLVVGFFFFCHLVAGLMIISRFLWKHKWGEAFLSLVICWFFSNFYAVLLIGPAGVLS